MSLRITLITLLLFAVLAPAALFGADRTMPSFTAELFKKQVETGLGEEDDARLVRNLTDLYGKFRTLNYPNCFECSLWLVNGIAETTPSKRLILAEYATLFAPDLPESHLNRFLAVLDLRPGDIGLMVHSLGRYLKATLDTAARDPFIAAICSVVKLFSSVLFLLLMIVMVGKYGRLLAHLYAHIGSFSLFHMVIATVIVLSGVVLAVKGVIGLELFFILWLFLCYRIMRYRELAILILSLVLYLVADIWLDQIVHTTPPERTAAADLYGAVYNPPFASRTAGEGSSASAALFTRGMREFYRGRFAAADALFGSAQEQERSITRLALLFNLRGVCASERGDHAGARKLYTEAVKMEERPAYLFNLSRAFFALGEIKEAEQIEMRAIAQAERASFTYPVVVLPSPYAFHREVQALFTPVSSDWRSDPLVRRSVGLLLLLLIAFFWGGIGVPGISLRHCIECGGIICEECGGTDDEVCITCRVVKAGKKLVSSDEIKRHTRRRERWAGLQRALAVAIAVPAPGAGLLYNDRIIEGTLYATLFGTVLALFFLPRFFPFVALTLPVPAVVSLIGYAVLAFVWLLSFYRTWRVAHNE